MSQITLVKVNYTFFNNHNTLLLSYCSTINKNCLYAWATHQQNKFCCLRHYQPSQAVKQTFGMTSDLGLTKFLKTLITNCSFLPNFNQRRVAIGYNDVLPQTKVQASFLNNIYLNNHLQDPSTWHFYSDDLIKTCQNTRCGKIKETLANALN